MRVALRSDGAAEVRRAHLIWAHPRRDSLTARVVAALKEEAATRDIEVIELDLYRSGFDPVLREADEPDWADPDKAYSPQVVEMAASLAAADVAIVVFPVWWYGLPAMLKGYIDRVWNYGLVYGADKRLPWSSVRWVALVGGSQHNFEKRGHHTRLTELLVSGIAGYCGVQDSLVTYLYNTLGYEEHTDDLARHHQALIESCRSVVAGLRPSAVTAR